MSQEYIPEKSFKSLGLWSPNRYETDLLVNGLNIDFGQKAAKISEVKVGVRKKYLPTWPTLGAWVRSGLFSRYFFRTRTLISLQPFDQNQRLVPYLKDLFHICLETKAQGF